VTRIFRHLGLAMLVIGLCLVAVGYCAGRASGHDIYTDWKMPGTDVSCCSERDCQPVRAHMVDEQWIVHVDGLEIPVPPERVLKIKSPDGRSHWCGIGVVTYCFVPGEVRS